MGARWWECGDRGGWFDTRASWEMYDTAVVESKNGCQEDKLTSSHDAEGAVAGCALVQAEREVHEGGTAPQCGGHVRQRRAARGDGQCGAHHGRPRASHGCVPPPAHAASRMQRVRRQLHRTPRWEEELKWVGGGETPCMAFL